MPPVVIAAGIAAAGSLAAAKMGSNANSKATKAQSAAADQALAFTREQEATRRAVYDQKMQQYTAMRNVLAERYGINLPPAASSGTPSVPAAAFPGATATAGGAEQPGVQGRTPPTPGPVMADAAQGMTLGDLARPGGAGQEWNDWRGYGLQ
jgi:hypothetical protein